MLELNNNLEEKSARRTINLFDLGNAIVCKDAVMSNKDYTLRVDKKYFILKNEKSSIPVKTCD